MTLRIKNTIKKRHYKKIESALENRQEVRISYKGRLEYPYPHLMNVFVEPLLSVTDKNYDRDTSVKRIYKMFSGCMFDSHETTDADVLDMLPQLKGVLREKYVVEEEEETELTEPRRRFCVYDEYIGYHLSISKKYPMLCITSSEEQIFSETLKRDIPAYLGVLENVVNAVYHIERKKVDIQLKFFPEIPQKDLKVVELLKGTKSYTTRTPAAEAI